MDDGCWSGHASCGTYLVAEDQLSVYRQVVECVAYPGTNEPFVTGWPGSSTVASCNSAVGWLHESSARLKGALRWASMKGLSFHFHLSPGGLESGEMHLGPTIYMALLSTATGWAADPKVPAETYLTHPVSAQILGNDVSSRTDYCLLAAGQHLR